MTDKEISADRTLPDTFTIRAGSLKFDLSFNGRDYDIYSFGTKNAVGTPKTWQFVKSRLDKNSWIVA